MRLEADQNLQATPLLAKQRLLFFGRRIPGNIALEQSMLQYVTATSFVGVSCAARPDTKREHVCLRVLAVFDAEMLAPILCL